MFEERNTTERIWVGGSAHRGQTLKTFNKSEVSKHHHGTSQLFRFRHATWKKVTQVKFRGKTFQT